MVDIINTRNFKDLLECEDKSKEKEGANGIVKFYTYKYNDKIYNFAIKFPISNDNDLEDDKLALKAINTNKNKKCKKYVIPSKYLEKSISEELESDVILMESATGTLYDLKEEYNNHIKSRVEKLITNDDLLDILNIFLDLTVALKCLVDINCYYTDLKLENIFYMDKSQNAQAKPDTELEAEKGTKTELKVEEKKNNLKNITILLGDIGSTICESNNEDGVATYPIPLIKDDEGVLDNVELQKKQVVWGILFMLFNFLDIVSSDENSVYYWNKITELKRETKLKKEKIKESLETKNLNNLNSLVDFMFNYNDNNNYTIDKLKNEIEKTRNKLKQKIATQPAVAQSAGSLYITKYNKYFKKYTLLLKKLNNV